MTTIARRQWTWIALSLIAVSTVVVAGKRQLILGNPSVAAAITPAADVAPPLPVCVQRVGTIYPPGLTRSYAGLLIAERESDLSFQRGGRILEIVKQEGDAVASGEQIAALDVEDLDAAEQRTRAELAAAEALLKELVAGPRKQSIDSARARVQQLVAQLELAKTDSERERQLASSGAGSQRSLDAATYGQRSIEEELKSARAELELLEEGTRGEQIAAQEAVCDSIRGRLSEIEVSRRHSIILAPFDGRVSLRFLDEGAVVEVGTPIVRVISNQVEGRFGLPAKVAPSLRPGDCVEVDVQGVSRTATIDRLEPTVDLTTRTRAVYVRVEQPRRDTDSESPAWRMDQLGWIAGCVASLHVPISGDRPSGQGASGNAPSSSQSSPHSGPEIAEMVSGTNPSYWVPTAALARGGRGIWSLLVLPGEQPAGVCERRAVELLQTDGQYSLVQGMIQRGERLITDGLHRITPGMRVAVASKVPHGSDADAFDDSTVSGQ